MSWLCGVKESTAHSKPMTCRPHISGNLSFTVSVDAVDLIRDQPIVGLLEGAVGSINGLLISAEATCQRLGFFS
jgi:hypothetical protein